MSHRALLIGINYRGTNAALRGCINDVHNMREYLISKGYPETCITIITEDERVKPTRKNIINAILDLLESDAKNLFLHYSGHGSWTPDTGSDESDRRDECLVPLDYQKAGMISDDQLSGLFTFMNPNAKMVAVLDCCHSGSALDLCYTLQNGRRFIKVGNKRVRRDELMMKKQGKYKDTPGQVVMISGCLDKQTSADAYIAKQSQGALTATLLECLKRKSITWEELIKAVRQKLKARKFTQIANLTSGQPLLLTEEFEV